MCKKIHEIRLKDNVEQKIYASWKVKNKLI